jgi:hypothetical protein
MERLIKVNHKRDMIILNPWIDWNYSKVEVREMIQGKFQQRIYKSERIAGLLSSSGSNEISILSASYTYLRPDSSRV